MAIECGMSNWPGPVPFDPHDFTQSPFLSVLGDARVDIPVGDVYVVPRVPGDVRRLPEVAVHRRQRRIWMPERLGAVGRFLFPPEHPHDASLRVEPDDHVRALVDGPDVVVPIDAHAVRLRPGIETLADLAYEIAVLIEFEELGRSGTERRAVRAVRAREDEYVAARVHCHARDLAEVHARRKIGVVGDRREGNLGHALLRERRPGEKHRHRKQMSLHCFLPFGWGSPALCCATGV